ncbi:M35 family metallo-endopeptidase [Variovorax boronicumulans]|uniref:M35 family metallo-endopeptidase n=1 Tax=Variovorax boronicumulans TaxID=436515 RepID=UPI003399D9EB
MMRKILVVGDPPAPGGRVLPYDGPLFNLYGHRVALIGGRAYCEGCNSVGIIAKVGGRRRPRFISEVALEGDVVICHCPVPQPLVSVLQQTAIYDDDDAHAAGVVFTGTELAAKVAPDPGLEMAAFKKAVDAAVTHPPEAEQTENICPNMTNKEFAAMALKLRDTAVDYITRQRLPELNRWDKQAQARVKTWFGIADQSTREHLQKGLASCVRVLNGLEAKNFVRFTEGGKLAMCVMGSASGTVAAVCKPDTATHTIAIALDFCTFKWDNKIHFETHEVLDGDSRLLTLLHEVTHFDDTFSSSDEWYGTRISRINAADPKNRAKARMNADSIAAYILGVTHEGLA